MRGFPRECLLSGRLGNFGGCRPITRGGRRARRSFVQIAFDAAEIRRARDGIPSGSRREPDGNVSTLCLTVSVPSTKSEEIFAAIAVEGFSLGVRQEVRAAWSSKQSWHADACRHSFARQPPVDGAGRLTDSRVRGERWWMGQHTHDTASRYGINGMRDAADELARILGCS